MSIVVKQTADGMVPVWTRPDKFPDLSYAKVLAIDAETKDESLQQGLGAGGAKGMGYMLGLSIATDKGDSYYFPFRHPETDNFDIGKFRLWAADQLCNPAQKKVFANCMYDLEWMQHEKIPIDYSDMVDILYWEPLIDSEQYQYNLEACAKKYLGKKYQKATDHMKDEVARVLGKTQGKTNAHLWRMPADRGVGGYAEMDALITLKIWQKQRQFIKADGLEYVERLEHRLVPILLAMRFGGIRINKRALNKTTSVVESSMIDLQKELDQMAGFPVNVNSTATVKELFLKHSLGEPSLKTKKGKVSYAAESIAHIEHPLLDLFRKTKKAHSTITFVHGIHEHMHNGRIHATLNPLKSETGGTVSGRFSANNINIQNQPGKKNPEMGALLRPMYVPEVGEWWCCKDYQQIELKMIVEYAARVNVKGGEEALQQYLMDPTTDFHAWVMEMTGLTRPHAKGVNFGLAFGMGLEKLARALDLSITQCAQVLEDYHEGVPFMKKLMNLCMERADAKGYIRTISGRRRRFNMWEPRKYEPGKRYPQLPREQALIAYGNIKRAGTFKAMNGLVQGSAADLMKEAMVQSWEAGVYSVLTPLTSVHDELNTSQPKNRAGKEAGAELNHIMTTALADKIKIPTTIDDELGPNWWKVA